MTIVYEPTRDLSHYRQRFALEGIPLPPLMWPSGQGAFVRRPRPDRAGMHPDAQFEVAPGRWGLIPLFAGQRDYPATFEARGETAAAERDFRQPWKRGHRCIVLADALYRRNDANQKVTRVSRMDGQPLALAGLWNGWRSAEGECVESFTLLTLPAEDQPGQRQVVFMRDGWIEDWLHCAVEEATAYLRPYNLRLLARTEVSALPAAPALSPAMPPPEGLACPR